MQNDISSFQIVEFTPGGHSANVNNATNSSVFLTYRRATEMSPCNELVVMDVCVTIGSKGEDPPHSFMKIDKTLNKGMVGSDVFICYKKSINRADLISYKPAVLSRFPPRDLPDYGLEETVALFCLPMGATLECWPAESARSASVKSTFVLTLANRSKVYGSAITFYEEVDEDAAELTQEQKEGLRLETYRRRQDRKIFTNKCICLLSRWPFFDAFEKFLFFLHKRQLMGPHDVPLERYVAHFLHDIPFPSPARPRILLQLDSHERIALSQPEELPLPRCGASFRNLLMNLGPDNCLQVLLLALTEQKILLHSLRPAVLTSVAEALMQIIFPFYWQCPYIPLCPIVMSDYLAAPLPFVIGLDSRFFDLYDQPADVNAVDLDTSTVTLCEEKRGGGGGRRASLTSGAGAAFSAAKYLPKRAARQLRTRLLRLTERCVQHASYARKLEAQMDDGAIDFDFTIKRKEQQLELEIREAFLHFMVAILSGYRNFLLPITSAPTVGATDAGNLFDQAGFLRSRDRSYHKFYNLLMRTQMFTKFIEERSFVSETNTCLAFFDECVESALVHHRRQLQGDHGGAAAEEPSFLELDGHYESDRTVFILPPEAGDLPPGHPPVEPTDTFKLDSALYPQVADADVDDGGGGAAEDNVGSSSAAAAAVADASRGGSILQTPASALARRTKQEIRSAQKLAKRNQTHPYFWARCLINTAYSLWFIHLPGLVLGGSEESSSQSGSGNSSSRPPHQRLRVGLALLQRMKRLRLHPADEICYRVMMQLSGEYNQPTLAVKVLFEMRKVGLHPNAVTYGYYNKAVLESEWPAVGEDTATRAQVLWTRVRNVLLAMAIFRVVGREKNFKDSRLMSASSNAVDAASSGASAAAVAAALAAGGEGGDSSDAAGKKEGLGVRGGGAKDLDGVSQGSSELSQGSSNAAATKAQEAPSSSSGANDATAAVSKDGSEATIETKDTGAEKSVEGNAAEGTEKEDDEGLQFRERLRSIVKPQGGEEEEGSPGENKGKC